jgi:hypothetical protein
MPDVDEATLATLQRSHDVLMKLNGDTRTRGLLEKGLKVHFPEVTTEEEAAARIVEPHLAAIREEMKPLAEGVQALLDQRKDDATARTTAQLEETFSHIRKNRGFTDEGIEQVKKLMVDRNIADPMAAAALFAEQNPPAPEAAAGFAPQHWNLDQNVTDFDVKGLFENEDRWADAMASKTLNEIRVGQAA